MQTRLNSSVSTDDPTRPSAEIRDQIARVRRAIDDGDTDTAEHEIAQLLLNAAEADRAHVLVAQAALHRAKGDVLDCARVAIEARHIAHTRGDTATEAEAHLYAGLAMQLIEDHAAAVEHFEAAEQLAVQASARSVEARALHRLGISASIIGRHAQALEYLDRSTHVFAQMGNKLDWLAARNSLLNAYSRRAETAMTDANERHEACLALLSSWDALAVEAEAAGIHRVAALARGNYAITQRYVGDYDGALLTLRGVLKHYEAFKMRANIAITYNEMGTLFVKLDRHPEALAAFDNALKHLIDGSKREQRDAYLGISSAREALGDAGSALAALKKVRELEAALTDDAARNAIERRELTVSMRRLSDEWERLAKEDTLTALPNRRALEQWMWTALSVQNERATGTLPVTLLMIDVDHFKRVNDRFGHAVGDRVLRVIADLMRENCRYADLPARFGGEEFILALPQTELAIGKVVAQRLNIAVEEYDWHRIQPDLKVTISIGVATTGEMPAEALNDTVSAMNALQEAADRRMYQAKNEGRNRVVA